MSHYSGGVDTGNALEKQVNANEVANREADDYRQLQMAALEKLDPNVRSKHAVLQSSDKDAEPRLVNIYGMGRATRKSLVEATLQTDDQDHEDFLKKLKKRMDEANVLPSTVEVQFKNLTVDAMIFLGNRSVPTVLNSYRNFFEALLGLIGIQPSKHRFVILDNISGTIKPGRMTLLLGPPGAGKSTLLKTLANKMQHEGCKITGEITYNGVTFKGFIPQRTAAYIEQVDLHLPEMTVRETMDFAARVQGTGHKADELLAMREAEKSVGKEQDPVMDAFLKAQTLEGGTESIVTEYMLKLLGLDVCADTVVGDAMLRGISGGQKKRVTTAEMVVGPKKTLFLDEISTGLDSSTTFQITKALRDFCHLREATILTALLQPQPEAYDLFDDVLLMAEGTIIYHGPREQIVPFFRSCGFSCPERKGVPDFLQEVTSKKDQGQYWTGNGGYRYIPVLEFADAFKKSEMGRENDQYLSQPFDSAQLGGRKDPLVYDTYALNCKFPQPFNALHGSRVLQLSKFSAKMKS